jgi:hypothetical protein
VRKLLCAAAAALICGIAAGQYQQAANLTDLRLRSLDNELRFRHNADGVLRGFDASGTAATTGAQTLTIDSGTGIANFTGGLATTPLDGTYLQSASVSYDKLNITNSIANDDIANTAAILYSKLNLADSIVDADIESGAGISYTKLALTNSLSSADILDHTITDVDISNSAAIDPAKFAPGTWSLASSDLRISHGSANDALKLTLGGSTPNQSVGINMQNAATITGAALTIGSGNTQDLDFRSPDGATLYGHITLGSYYGVRVSVKGYPGTTDYWGTGPDGSVVGDNVLSNRDVHGRKDVYGYLGVVAGVQDHTQDSGSMWFNHSTDGLTPDVGIQETHEYVSAQGFHFRNHHGFNQGPISASFNFDDSILTSGSLETSGSVRAAGDVYAAVYHGSGASLTGVVTAETDTLASVTGRGAATSTNVTFSGRTLTNGIQHSRVVVSSSTYTVTPADEMILTDIDTAESNVEITLPSANTMSGQVVRVAVASQDADTGPYDLLVSATDSNICEPSDGSLVATVTLTTPFRGTNREFFSDGTNWYYH